MTRPGGPLHVAPRVLDPVLALVERMDRWRRGIRPVRSGALLGLERSRHRGAAVDLGEGRTLEAGDPVWTLHIDNARLRGLTVDADRWPTRAYAAAVADLETLARRIASTPAGDRPVALGGVTLLAPLARRLGFRVAARPRTPRARLEDWYLRSLLARWAPSGRERLARGHGEMRTAATWISTGDLLRRYGPPPG
jgi:hypothetical protein